MYVWRSTKRIAVDVRGRWRNKLEERNVQQPDVDRLDFFARAT